MKAVAPLLVVLVIVLAAGLGSGWAPMEPWFGVILPYGALLAFLGGITWRVLAWARAPVPFNITTTCGQQHSLPWIRSSRLGNPHTRWGVAGRLALEMLLFRSLLRNVKHVWVEDKGDTPPVCSAGFSLSGSPPPALPGQAKACTTNGEPRLVYKASLGLWAGALVFHYSLLLVLLHHARFFLEPVPRWLEGIAGMDAFFRVGSVAFFLSGVMLLLAGLFLLGRRLWEPWLRYLSLPADFFPLYLLLGIATTGGLMHYTVRTNIPAVKDFCLGLAGLHPVAVAGLGPLFHIHLTLVSVLFAYVPFSKLAHMVSLPLSPTRNLVGAGRMVHHENPWNYPVKVHTYEEYENEYRGKMKAAGIPLEKETP